MYQIAYIGRWETLPETAVAIYEHDIPKLEALLQGGLDLGAPIQLSEYIKLMPLEIAVFRNDVPMIHFLLEHGADPGRAEEQPLLLTAARCCGPEVVALFAEQTAILSPKQKERAIQEVRWGKRPENIQVLEQAGDHSGQVWRRGIPGRCVRGQHQTCPTASGKRGRHQLPQARHGVSERPHRCHRSGSA